MMQIEIPRTTPPPLSDRPVAPIGAQKMKFWGRAIWVSAALMIAAPMLGLLWTFADIYKNLDGGGIADTNALADHISKVLLYTLGSMIFSVAGLVLLVVSIIRFYSWRAKLQPPAS
jgi:hypothetical protein